MKIIICDDDRNFVDAFLLVLRQLLDKAKISSEITVFQNPENLTRGEFSDAILFLDIDMPQMSGFEAADILREKQRNLILVFVSNKNELIFDAQDYGPLFFIRKAHMKEELTRRLPEIIKRMCPTHIPVQIQSGRDTLNLLADEVEYVEAQKNYLLFHCADSIQKARGSISSIETEWEEYGFIRVHTGILVNSNFINTYDNHELILASGDRLPISRSKFAEVKEKILEAMLDD